MTLARKGTRSIVVGGVRYRWKVRGKPSYSQANGWTPLVFVVEHADTPGTLLVVSTPYPHPSNWLGLPATAVLPRTVAATIERALRKGWRPMLPGPPFVPDLTGT